MSAPTGGKRRWAWPLAAAAVLAAVWVLWPDDPDVPPAPPQTPGATEPATARGGDRAAAAAPRRAPPAAEPEPLEIRMTACSR